MTTITATATAARYTVALPNGQTIEFGAKADYAFVVIAHDVERDSYWLRLKTNSESAARAKVAKVVATGDRAGREYRGLIIPVAHS